MTTAIPQPSTRAAALRPVTQEADLLTLQPGDRVGIRYGTVCAQWTYCGITHDGSGKLAHSVLTFVERPSTYAREQARPDPFHQWEILLPRIAFVENDRIRLPPLHCRYEAIRAEDPRFSQTRALVDLLE